MNTSLLYLKISRGKSLKPYGLLSHRTQNFSLSFVRKTKFVYADLVEKRRRGVELSNALALNQQAGRMIEKLNSNQKLSENKIHLAKLAGIRIIDGAPVPGDKQLLEYFANDEGSIKGHKAAIKNNKKEMEDMVKGE